MNRRQLFPALFAAAVTAPAAIASAVAESPDSASPPASDPNLWCEMTCQASFPDHNSPLDESCYQPRIPCNTRFKFLRGHTMPCCPKCGCVQNLHMSDELRSMMYGVEIKP